MSERGTEEKTRGHTYMQWIVALLANLTTLSYGFESGWTSPVTKLLQSDSSPAGVPLSDKEIAWVASILNFAAAVGVPLFGYLSDVYGSKLTIILLNIPFVVAWLIKIISSSTVCLIIARVISGLSAGGTFIVIPMYIKEISQDNIRGILGSLVVLSQNIGTFIMFTIGSFVDYFTVMYISLALPVVAGLLMIKAPQSPLFLVKQNKTEEAAHVLAYLRGLSKDSKKVQDELEYMKKEEDRFRALPDLSIKSIVKEPYIRRGLLLMLFIFTFRSFSATVMIFHASAILISTGVKFNINPDLQSLSLPAVQILASILLTTVIERCGRKILLVGGFFMTFVAMTMLAGAVWAQRLGMVVPSWLPVCAMILASFMFAGGVSPLPYIILTEMFSYQIRAKVMSGVLVYTWFSSFAAVALYTPLSLSFGEYITWFIFGIVNLLGTIFVLFLLPETKGKNYEEIQKLLTKEKKREILQLN